MNVVDAQTLHLGGVLGMLVEKLLSFSPKKIIKSILIVIVIEIYTNCNCFSSNLQLCAIDSNSCRNVASLRLRVVGRVTRCSVSG